MPDWVDTIALAPMVAVSTVGLAGETDGQATVAGTLSRVVGLFGRSDGVATVAASTIHGVVGLRGASAGVEVVIADLNTIFVKGRTDGVSTVAGDLTVSVPLAGRSDGGATVQALKPHLAPLAVYGHATGSSTVGASLLQRSPAPVSKATATVVLIAPATAEVAVG